MLNSFLEFKMRVYDTSEWEEYIDRVRQDSEKWENMGISRPNKDNIEIPVGSVGRVKIKPENISHYVETFSLKAKTENPENPVMDSVTVTLNSGEDFAFEISYDEFEQALVNFFNKPKKRQSKKTISVELE